MATIKFRLKSKVEKKGKTIYVYLSNGRGNMFEVKSGFSISPQDWHIKSGFPKQNNPTNKNIHSDLKTLEAFIHDSINSAYSEGVMIDKLWLELKIKECFNRVVKTDSEVLVNHIQYFIDNANTRYVKGKKSLGLEENTIKGYKTFLGVIKNYQKLVKRTIRLSEINSRFVDEFTKWLLINEKQGMSYAGKNIDKLKSVCNDALRLGLPVNPFAIRIQSFKEPNKDRTIVTLSFEEQKKIAETEMPSESLENVKKWLIIGCTIGQRGTDLLNVSIQNSRIVEGVMCIDVWQKKVDNWVTVPVFYESIANIILNEKPYAISLQKLNLYVKTVCKIAGIDTLTKGGVMKVEAGINTPTKGGVSKVDDNKVKRKVKDVYPKWELITTHSFRRSFITNYDKIIPRAILMGITGHTKESDYLYYINKQADKDDNARLFVMYHKQMLQTIKENNENVENDQ